jgi:hypothetical protein
MNGYLDPSAELTLKDAAALCGVSDKTLQRDHDDHASPISFIRRGNRNYVTVQMLIDGGRYRPGDPSAATVAECRQLRELVETLRAENVGLLARLEVAMALHTQAQELLEKAIGVRNAAVLPAVA